MSVVPTICQKVEKAVRTSIDRRKEKVSLEYEHMRGLIRFVTTLVKLHKRMAKLDAKVRFAVFPSLEEKEYLITFGLFY